MYNYFFFLYKLTMKYVRVLDNILSIETASIEFQKFFKMYKNSSHFIPIHVQLMTYDTWIRILSIFLIEGQS